MAEQAHGRRDVRALSGAEPGPRPEGAQAEGPRPRARGAPGPGRDAPDLRAGSRGPAGGQRREGTRAGAGDHAGVSAGSKAQWAQVPRAAARQACRRISGARAGALSGAGAESHAGRPDLRASARGSDAQRGWERSNPNRRSPKVTEMGTDPTGGGGGGGGGGAKRRRADRQGEQREAAAAAEGEAPTDRISALPVELRERIMARLAFMDAVRSGALARGWRDLWKSYCSSVQIRLDDHDAPQRKLDALEREPRPRRRLHRFSLSVKTRKFTSSHLQSFLDHAAECCVEDLDIDMWKASSLKLHLKQLSPHLARLSLHRCGGISRIYKGSQTLRALEVIELDRVTTTQSTFKKKLFPRLRILDLRKCNISFSDSYMVWPASLRSVTVAGCKGKVNLEGVQSLRSFRYSGSFVDAPFSLPRDAALADLYICFREAVAGDYNARRLNNTLPNDLSGLNVLTICSNALPVALTCELPKQRSLHSLRELQLLMLEMGPSNLADIYVFLRTFHAPNLEKLFVELPDDPKEGSHDEVGEEPPENCLDNVKIVKVVNFNWHRTEVELVSFLLRNASSLQKLLLVFSKAAPLDMPGGQRADLLLIHEALTNGKIMLSESDDVATQPYHYEVFLEV